MYLTKPALRELCLAQMPLVAITSIVDVKENAIDVHLADWVSVEKVEPTNMQYLVPGVDTLPVYIKDISKGYDMAPDTFITAAVAEKINIPNNLTGLFLLDSNLARLGLQHSVAIGLIPGWQGILALELSLSTKYHGIKLTGGMPIGKILFSQHEETDGYKGRYQNQSLEKALGVN